MSTELNNNTSTVRTYRGRSLEELIPRIREELGPDAIILREREGLTGGFNGFFAQRCVEVDARPGTGIDFYDEERAAHPEAPAAEADELVEEPAVSAVAAPYVADPPPAQREEPSFSERLATARRERDEFATVAAAAPQSTTAAAPQTTAAAAPETTTAAVPETPDAVVPQAAPASAAYGAPVGRAAAERPAPAAHLDNATAGTVARELIGRGISEAWAHELIVSAAAHLAPFAPDTSLREAARATLATAISAAPPLPSSGAAVAFVGSGGAGKTSCAAALAAAYHRGSTLGVSVISLDPGARGHDVEIALAGRGIQVQSLRGETAAGAVADGRDAGLVVIDAGATSPVDRTRVAALAAELAPLALDAVYLAVPATLSASAARGLLDGLDPLAPNALVITHADETEELGIAVELAYLSGLPIAFVHGGLDVDHALFPADPAGVAARVLP